MGAAWSRAAAPVPYLSFYWRYRGLPPPAPLLLVWFPDLISQYLHSSIAPSLLPITKHLLGAQVLEWLPCKYPRESLPEQRPSQPQPSLQQNLVPTEDEDVLEALEVGGLVLVLLLFRQLLGDHASVAETRSQPG